MLLILTCSGIIYINLDLVTQEIYIPTKVYGDDSTLCDDPDIVLHEWMRRTALDPIEAESTTFILWRLFCDIEFLISFQHTVHSSTWRKPSIGLIECKCVSYWPNSDCKGSCTKLLSQSTVCHRLASVLITVAQIGLILSRGSNRATHSRQLHLQCVFNNSATGVKGLGCGVNVDDIQICILSYADDIVFIAPDENKLQVMLNFISD